MTANQLSLFDEIPIDYDAVLTDKANKLVEMLNEGLKKKEQYERYLTTQVNELFVLVVINDKKEMLGNILDIYGKTPNNCSVNWRFLNIVKQDIEEFYNIKH